MSDKLTPWNRLLMQEHPYRAKRHTSVDGIRGGPGREIEEHFDRLFDFVDRNSNGDPLEPSVAGSHASYLNGVPKRPHILSCEAVLVVFELDDRPAFVPLIHRDGNLRRALIVAVVGVLQELLDELPVVREHQGLEAAAHHRLPVEERTILNHEVKRDEVATDRLKRCVRKLITEDLPKLDDVAREKHARSQLEPHRLVYLLLDDRSVEVKFPVIRGGRVLSYESARDASGSGNTGQKSAGFVIAFHSLLRYLGSVGSLSEEKMLFVALENQFGKISSSKIISDIKEVVDQTNMQLITVAGRELRSAYAMGNVVFSLHRQADGQAAPHGLTHAMRVKVNESGQLSADAVIDKFRATRTFENLTLNI